MQLRDLYYCQKCRNLVEVVHAGAPALICCGDPMLLLNANSTDAAGEKHVPVIADKGDYVEITVGSVDHPMTPEHYIAFIEVLTAGGVCRKELKPDGKPVAVFQIKRSEIIEVREFCNLHLLWKAN